jgi:hypothetical protein
VFATVVPVGWLLALRPAHTRPFEVWKRRENGAGRLLDGGVGLRGREFRRAPLPPATADQYGQRVIPLVGLGRSGARAHLRREEAVLIVGRFQNLPLADRHRTWNTDAADKRIRRRARAESAPNARYRKVFLLYDVDRRDEFTADKLPIAYVIDGELRAAPKGTMAAAGVVSGVRGGVALPARDVSAVKRAIAGYYAKLDDTALTIVSGTPLYSIDAP